VHTTLSAYQAEFLGLRTEAVLCFYEGLLELMEGEGRAEGLPRAVRRLLEELPEAPTPLLQMLVVDSLRRGRKDQARLLVQGRGFELERLRQGGD
jgi:hypothetical protein